MPEVKGYSGLTGTLVGYDRAHPVASAIAWFVSLSLFGLLLDLSVRLALSIRRAAGVQTFIRDLAGIDFWVPELMKMALASFVGLSAWKLICRFWPKAIGHCPRCGLDLSAVPDDFILCPHCGTKIPPGSRTALA